MRKSLFILSLFAFSCQPKLDDLTPPKLQSHPDTSFAHTQLLGKWNLNKVLMVNCGTKSTPQYVTNIYLYFSNYQTDHGWYLCNPKDTYVNSQQFKINGDSIYFRYPSGYYPYSYKWKISNDSLVLSEPIGIYIHDGATYYHCSNLIFASR